MAAKSANHDRRSSSLAFRYTNFKKLCVVSSRGRQYANHGRSNLNFKRHYEYRKPPYQTSYQSAQSPQRQSPKNSNTTTKQQ